MRDQGFRGSAKRANTSSPISLDSLPESIIDNINDYLDTNQPLRNTSKQYNSQLCPKQFSSRHTACQFSLHPNTFKTESDRGLGKRVNLTGCIPPERHNDFFDGLCTRLKHEKCFTEELKINYPGSLQQTFNVVKHIPNCIAAAKHLKTLTVLLDMQHFTHQLESLPLNIIMPAIATNRTCSTLRLGRQISDIQGVSIGEFLKFNESVTSLDVSNNHLGARSIQTLLCVTPRTNTSLTRVDLSENRLGGNILEVILSEMNGDDGTPPQPSLKYLNLKNNRITDFHRLGAFLSIFQSLTYLDMSFNRPTALLPGNDDVDMMDNDTFIKASSTLR